MMMNRIEPRGRDWTSTVKRLQREERGGSFPMMGRWASWGRRGHSRSWTMSCPRILVNIP